MPPTAHASTTRASARGTGLAWALVATVVVAWCLRAPVTSLGPVLPSARAEMARSVVILLPAVVNERAPGHIGIVTGAYTASLAGASALAAAVTAPMADAFGLRISLWAWVMFGTQATTAYITMGWLPTVLQGRGSTPTVRGCCPRPRSW